MGVLDEEGVCILGGRGVGEVSCSSLWLSSVANQLSLHHTTHKHHPQFPPSQNNSNTLPPHTGKTFDTTNPNLPVSKISITYKKPALNYKLHQKKPPKFLPHSFSPFPFLFLPPPPIPSFSPSTYSIPFSTLYIPLSPPPPEFTFCSLHRLPEQHQCSFDHKESSRKEARTKMVLFKKHVGTALKRLDNDL